MSGSVRRPARLPAVTALAAAVVATLLTACGTGGPEVGAARAVVGSDDTSALPPGDTAPAAGSVTPTGSPAATPSTAPAASRAPRTATGTASRTTPAPSGSAAPSRPSAGTGEATRGTPIPKGAVLVGSGSAASCTASALRSAVARVVKRGSGTVSFDCGAAPVRIALSRPLAFTGTSTSRYVLDGRRLVTLDGRNATGLVTLPNVAGLSATFRGLEFTRASTRERGAAIHGGWRNRLLVENCVFTSNAVTKSSDGEAGGGAIYVHEGTATVRRSTFRGNTAAHGGALQNVIGDVVVESSTFTDNRVTGNGGGIYSDSGSLVLRASTVSGNKAVHEGGGLFVWNAKNKTSRIERSTISGNRMTGSGRNNGFGAGIRNGSGPLVITDSTISRNVTYNQGGGLYNADDAAVTIKRTRFERNKAVMGGAIMRVSGTISTVGCTFTRNTPADVR